MDEKDLTTSFEVDSPLKIANKLNEIWLEIRNVEVVLNELNEHMKLHCDQIHYMAGLLIALVTETGLAIPKELKEIENGWKN